MGSQHAVRAKSARRQSLDLDPFSTAQVYYGDDRDPTKDRKLRTFTNVSQKSQPVPSRKLNSDRSMSRADHRSADQFLSLRQGELAEVDDSDDLLGNSG